MTGAAYESRKRRWLLSTPRHHADSTSRPAPGNRMRTSRIVSSRFSPSNPGAITSMRSGVRQDADEHDDARPTSARSEATAPATRSASRRSPRASERRIHRDERRRERAFAEQVLQEVGNAERGVERVGGVGAEAEVVREDALPDEAGQPRQQNAGRDEERRNHGGHGRSRLTCWGHGGSAQTSSSGTGSPSVPLDFFIR